MDTEKSKGIERIKEIIFRILNLPENKEGRNAVENQTQETKEKVLKISEERNSLEGRLKEIKNIYEEEDKISYGQPWTEKTNNYEYPHNLMQWDHSIEISNIYKWEERVAYLSKISDIYEKDTVNILVRNRDYITSKIPEPRVYCSDMYVSDDSINIALPFLKTHFKEFIGVNREAPISFRKFKKLIKKNLALVFDPSERESISYGLEFEKLEKNKFEVRFHYNGLERSVIIYYDKENEEDFIPMEIENGYNVLTTENANFDVSEKTISKVLELLEPDKGFVFTDTNGSELNDEDITSDTENIWHYIKENGDFSIDYMGNEEIQNKTLDFWSVEKKNKQQESPKENIKKTLEGKIDSSLFGFLTHQQSHTASEIQEFHLKIINNSKFEEENIKKLCEENLSLWSTYTAKTKPGYCPLNDFIKDLNHRKMVSEEIVQLLKEYVETETIKTNETKRDEIMLLLDEGMNLDKKYSNDLEIIKYLEQTNDINEILSFYPKFPSQDNSVRKQGNSYVKMDITEEPLLYKKDIKQESNVLKYLVETLIYNAYYHSEKKDKKDFQVLVKTEKEQNGFAKITVSDNGSGIRKDIFQRIFEQGFSTKEREGGGQGLFLTKEYLKLKKGNIQIDTKNGKEESLRINFDENLENQMITSSDREERGTTVTIWIPLQEE